jgi:hypothetical protein
LADFTIGGLPKNYRYEGDVLGLAEPYGTESKMLGRSYSNSVVIAMKFLTFADLFFFFLWKTWRAKISRVGHESVRRNELAGEVGIERPSAPAKTVAL